MGLLVAFSGGKDSTAMALRLAELGEDFSLLFTPTGNELPDLAPHIEDVVARIARPLLLPPGGRTLREWIEFYHALPSPKMRWCTRLIKIVPCIAYLKRHPGSVLAVGLRADEEEREGLYGDFATYRYPLREWGWGLKEVKSYLHTRAQSVPKRTDCALCPYQKTSEWWSLWRNYPALYQEGEDLEASTGHTFRTPRKEAQKWPVSLADLRRRFEGGAVPQGRRRGSSVAQDDLFEAESCRVCRF